MQHARHKYVARSWRPTLSQEGRALNPKCTLSTQLWLLATKVRGAAPALERWVERARRTSSKATLRRSHGLQTTQLHLQLQLHITSGSNTAPVWVRKALNALPARPCFSRNVCLYSVQPQLRAALTQGALDAYRAGQAPASSGDRLFQQQVYRARSPSSCYHTDKAPSHKVQGAATRAQSCAQKV